MVVNGILRDVDLNELLKLKLELLAKNDPPLKAVKMSRATAATFPTVPAQAKVETLYSVPIQWDETLNLNEYVPVYQ